MTANSTDVSITYLILAHDDPVRLQALIEKLEEDPTATIVIHYDRKSPRQEYQRLFTANENKPNVHVLPKAERVACGWGEFSIVQATLNLIHFALKLPETGDYFYLLSGACYPLKPLHELKAYLAKHRGRAFIECEDSSWIQAGMQDDRYKYHHFLNFRKYPWLFRRVYWLQRDLDLKRKLPKGINEIRFGSQWWCLPITLINKVLQEIGKSPEVVNFFKTVWIPDECFFQTIIYPYIYRKSRFKKLTFYEFDNEGKPKVYNLNELKDVDFFFARKIK